MLVGTNHDIRCVPVGLRLLGLCARVFAPVESLRKVGAAENFLKIIMLDHIAVVCTIPMAYLQIYNK